MKKESTFTGSNWGIIGRLIVMSFGMALTYYIAAPWLLAWYYRWYYENTIIDNKRLEFTGTGKDMLFFYTFLVVTVLTFGIAAFFMMAWLQRKIMSFVHIANNEE